MNFKDLFTYNYQFYVNPVLVDKADKIYPLIGAVFILLAITFKIAAMLAPSPVDKKYRNSFFNALLFSGIWEIIWFGLRWQNIRFFGSHFVAWLGLGIGLAWVIYRLVKMLRHYGEEKRNWEKEQVKLKYLPK